MIKKYDDDFFDDLDKTTDLLKAFKPHIESESYINDFDDIYSELKIDNKVEHKKDNNKNNIGFKNVISEKKEKLEPISEKKIHVKRDDEHKIHDLNELFEKKYKSIETNNKKESKILKEDKKNDVSQIIEDIRKKSEIAKEKENKIVKPKKKKKNKVKTKFSKFEIIFCSFSFLFIIGCLCVYSTRFLKYYKIYNPKGNNGKNLMLLNTAIGKNSTLVYEGDGLYMSGGEYIYKGDNVNNYIVFSNLMWRIIKTNNDGTIDLVLDDYINTLNWNNQYNKYVDSDINKYLNEYFIKYLDTKYLEKTPICIDDVNDIKKFSCENKNEDYYVRLLSVNEFLNSKTDTTYISNDKSVLWLSTVSSEKVWQINGLSLSLSQPNRMLGIKPVVKLKNDVALISGEGTKENPYIISEKDNNVNISDYVKLGDDVYVVYNVDGDYLDLALSNVYSKTYRYSTSEIKYNLDDKNSLAFFLNNWFLNKLPYKNLLVDKKWNDGVYDTSYEAINSSNVVAKVGLLNVSDLKFDNNLKDYFLLNGNGSKIYTYGDETIVSNPGIFKSIRPAIRIKNNKVSSGQGTKENPYILGE